MVCTSWAAVLGSRTRVDADNRSLTNPLTGEPDAGDPPVRFGGRGSGQPLSLPLSTLIRYTPRTYGASGSFPSKLGCLSPALSSIRWRRGGFILGRFTQGVVGLALGYYLSPLWGWSRLHSGSTPRSAVAKQGGGEG